MTATIIPKSVFLAALERKRDPKGYEAKKIHAAIDRQVNAREEADRPLLIGETPSLDSDFDIEDVPVMDRALYWGPEYANHFERQRLLNRYFAEQQSDPGDEI